MALDLDAVKADLRRLMNRSKVGPAEPHPPQPHQSRAEVLRRTHLVLCIVKQPPS